MSTPPVRRTWSREAEFESSNRGRERWTYRSAGREASFEVECRYGKTIDLAAIKRRLTFPDELAFTRKIRDFFDGLGDFVATNACPVCATSAEHAVREVVVWGVDYVRCAGCSHAYARKRPSDQALADLYSTNAISNDYYMQPEEVSLRIREIYGPKVEWIAQTFESIHGRPPATLLELGAGTGHLLATARERGMDVHGLEPDRTYRDFCRRTFDLELFSSAEELRERGRTSYDVVCSFNVLEHVTAPGTFLDLYRDLTGRESLWVIETPRYNSLTIALQKLYPERIRGYLVPYEHVQLFSDASLATLLVEKGARPSHVWYFGQDAMELIFQVTAELDVAPGTSLAGRFNDLQSVFDRGRLSDLMLFAAVPLPQG